MRGFLKLVTVCVILLILAAAAALAVLYTLGSPKKPAASIELTQGVEGMPVVVTTPVPMSFTEYTYCDGAVVADVRAMLRARVEEVVETVNARVGEPVQKGDVLVVFRKADLEAAVQAAETAFREAESNLERYTKLAEQQVIPADRLEQVRTARDVAASNLKSARSRLAFAEVTSPIDGFVEERWVEPGEHKSIGNELMSVVDLSAVEVRALVPDQGVAGISVGSEADFQTESEGEWLTGRVDRISPATEDPNRFFEVFLKVQNRRVNDNWLLRPGTYAEVRFLRRVVNGALAVPASSVAFDGNDRVVYVVEEGLVTVPDLEARENAEEPGAMNNIKRGLARAKGMFGKGGKNGGNNPGESFTKEVSGLVARRLVVHTGLTSGDFLQITDGGITVETPIITRPRDDLKDGTFVRVLEGGETG